MKTVQIPDLSTSQQAANHALTQLIAADIAQNGPITFSRFMQHALYAPQYGYYTGGAHKIGSAGDFITAPILSPLFGQTLAKQIAQVLPQTAGNIYEFGAGTGHLATQIMSQLSGSLKNYYIIELSPDLAQRQRQYIEQTIPNLAKNIIWLDTLPETFDGVIIGNEVLDAMPIERIHRNAHGKFERVYVDWQNGQFVSQNRALDDEILLQAACDYFPNIPNYTSELHPTQYAFTQTLAKKLSRGAIIWLDYGFDAKQYYHPERTEGTLIGHHRHHSIHDPFYRIGLTDLTAHVNFSDIAAAGCYAGLDLIGYTTQANFLFNLGLLDLLTTQFPQTDTPEYIQAAHAVHVLTAPHEMGELFKVIAFGKNVDVDWQGFCIGDLCHKL